MQMPTPGGQWLASATAVPDPRPARRAPSLVAAVAGIVAIAAERARSAGDLGSLREAIERVLDAAAPPAADPRGENNPAELPRIDDADPLREEQQLRALLARLQPG